MAYKNNKRAVKKNKQRKRLFVSFLVLCGLLGIGFLFLMRIEILQIKSVVVTGNSFVPTEDIKISIDPLFSESHFFVIPGTNSLFFSRSSAERVLLDMFREIESVSVNRVGFTGLDVVVSEREARYVYCKDTCYSFDASGLLFKDLALEDQSPRYVFTSKKTHDMGDIYLGPHVISELDVLLDSINKKGLEIRQIQEQSDFTIALITKQGTRVLVPKMSSYDQVYSLFVKLLNTEEFKLGSDSNDFKKAYAYINMQFGKKIFSCLRGEECANNYK